MSNTWTHPNDTATHFDSRPHALLAEPIAVWAAALRGVDRSQPAPFGDDTWRLWMPNPSTLVRASDATHTDMIVHWLQLRGRWCSLLQQSPDLTGQTFRTWEWTDLLAVGLTDIATTGENTSRTLHRRLELQRKFLAMTANNSVDCPWSGAEIEGAVAKQISWEVAEMGFRLELCALDKHLCGNKASSARLIDAVFANRSLTGDSLPCMPYGLAHPSAPARKDSLEALRQIVARWPKAPTLVSQNRFTCTTSDDIQTTMEQTLAKFYVQSFWENAGRAATIPRMFPFLAP